MKKKRLLTSSIIALSSISVYSFSIKAESSSKWQPKARINLKTGTQRSLGQIGILSPLGQDNSSMLFMDARFMRDSQKNMEGNFGLGYRSLEIVPDKILGIYGFFDDRYSKHRNLLYQITLGTELLSTTWDYRLNTYYPLSSPKGIKGGPLKKHYVGYELYETSQKEIPLTGLDYEIGRTVPNFEDLQFYVGGYHFGAHHSKPMNGSRVRSVYSVNDYVSLNAEFQYDNIRKYSNFFGVSFTIPLGEDTSQKRQKLSPLERRMTSEVVRDVDIVSNAVQLTQKKDGRYVHVRKGHLGNYTAEQPGQESFENPNSFKKFVEENQISHVVDENGNVVPISAYMSMKHIETSSHLIQEISVREGKSPKEIEQNHLWHKTNSPEETHHILKNLKENPPPEQEAEIQDEPLLDISALFNQNEIIAKLADEAAEERRTEAARLAAKEAKERAAEEAERLRKETARLEEKRQRIETERLETAKREAAAKKAAEEEARRKEAQRLAEEEEKKKETEGRAAEEAKRKATEEAERLAAEQEVRRKEAEARKAAKEEAERIAAEQEVRRKEAERLRIETEQRAKEKEDAAKKAAEEAKRIAVEEAERLKKETARLEAERLKIETERLETKKKEDAARKAAAEEAKKKEAERLAAEEVKRLAAQRAVEEAKELAALKAAEEKKIKEAAARLVAEEEIKRKEAARLAAEEAERLRIEAEQRAKEKEAERIAALLENEETEKLASEKEAAAARRQAALTEMHALRAEEKKARKKNTSSNDGRYSDENSSNSPPSSPPRPGKSTSLPRKPLELLEHLGYPDDPLISTPRGDKELILLPHLDLSPINFMLGVSSFHIEDSDPSYIPSTPSTSMYQDPPKRHSKQTGPAPDSLLKNVLNPGLNKNRELLGSPPKLNFPKKGSSQRSGSKIIGNYPDQAFFNGSQISAESLAALSPTVPFFGNTTNVPGPQ
ncbi:MAG: inverse autotransporter beta domain-containing protein, partial [Proteobacteria bacterium]|nr:inverse autotransporter beta domain-containing protein [Pseudomonadota bacterium]